MEPTSPDYTIRECTTFEEFEACLQMQRRVWQFDAIDILPLRSLISNRRTGGFTLGAFEMSGEGSGQNAERLVGFAHAFPAFDDQLKPYYHSQTLAVEPARQNSGIGVRLKLAQRKRALDLGVPLIAWTFDPLQSRNAYLNLVKLGGVVRRYLVNHYGNRSTSILHQGLDTDRLIIEWWVGSGKVREALEGLSRTAKPDVVVEVPRNIEAIKERDLAEARDWQMKVRGQFQKCLTQGLYCAGFEVDSGGGNNHYLFFKDDHPEHL